MDAFGQWSSLQKSIFRRTPSARIRITVRMPKMNPFIAFSPSTVARRCRRRMVSSLATVADGIVLHGAALCPLEKARADVIEATACHEAQRRRLNQAEAERASIARPLANG